MRIEITRYIRIVLIPPVIILLAWMASFVAWIFPTFGIFDKGFVVPESFFDYGILYVIAWYSTAVGCSLIGFSLIPKNVSKSALARVSQLDQEVPYVVFSAVTSIATLFLLYTLASRSGIPALLDAVFTGKANFLKETLYLDYSIGIFSLRYLAIFSGALAGYRISQRGKLSLLDGHNLICLLLTVLVSSRLSLVAATLVFICLYSFNSPRIIIKPVKILLLGIGLFLLLGVFNYSRNFGFYQEKESYGFISSNISQILSYLSTPFQTSLALGNHPEMMQQDGDFIFLAQIDSMYTTNSAMAALVGTFGLLKGWCVLAVTTFTAGLASAFLLRYRHTYFFVVYGIILYAFAELWRIFMFNKGIFTTLVILGLLLPLSNLILSPILRRKGGAA